PRVPQGLDQVAEIVVAAQQPGAGKDLDVGLLDQVLRELARAAHRARRSKEHAEVVAGRLRIEAAFLPLGGHRGQNRTAPSPFQEASLTSSRSPTSALVSTQVRPSRHQVTTRRPPSTSVCSLTPSDVVGAAPAGAWMPAPETIVYAMRRP